MVAPPPTQTEFAVRMDAFAPSPHMPANGPVVVSAGHVAAFVQAAGGRPVLVLQGVAISPDSDQADLARLAESVEDVRVAQ